MAETVLDEIRRRTNAMAKASMQHEDVTQRLLDLLQDIVDYEALYGFTPQLRGVSVILLEWLQIEEEANAVMSVPETP